jgi:Arc/MetJ-type ribon-helix-helix transcriptional regulator
MADTLTLTLPEPLAREVQRAVESGGYSQPVDVVTAALKDWVERGSPPAMTNDRLRELVREADQAGEEPDEDFDIEELIAEAHRSSPSKR